eukprot:g5244.t2
MRTTPLPPTWTIAPTTSTDQAVAPEYVNRGTGERTAEHPGKSYFVSLVEHERCSNRQQGLGAVPILLSSSPARATSYGCSGNGTSTSTSGGTVEIADRTPSSPIQGPPQQGGWRGGPVSSIGAHRNSAGDGQGIASGMDGTSEGKIVRKEEEKQEIESMAVTNSAEEKSALGNSTASRKRASSNRGKRAKRRMAPPKWLVFTSWWHETISGTENVMNRKHASIRFNTANASFEVELEDVPAIFEVSHATGRYGKIGTIDVRVGAQISILGRQMRLMQCDGLTAQWLESEVRAITKAKVALISALEQGKDTVRVTCRSDRLELSASAQRGSGSVGLAAEMDRRGLMQDVLVLRDKLAQTQPDEAMRLTKDLDL